MQQWWLWFSAIALVISSHTADGSIMWRRENGASNGTKLSLVYNALPWERNTDQVTDDAIKWLPITYLDTPFQLFNPCDLSTFTPEHIQSLVQLSTQQGIDRNNTRSNSIPEAVLAQPLWVAVVRDYAVKLSCTITPLHLAYATYAAHYAQKAGAMALVLFNPEEAGVQYVHVPPSVDIRLCSVYGERLKIPCLTLADELAMEGWLSSSDAFYSNLQLSALLRDDINPYDAIFQPLSLYRIAFLSGAAISFLVLIPLSAHTFWINCRPLVSNRILSNNKRDARDASIKISTMQQEAATRTLKLLLSLATFIASVCASLTGLDPLGSFFTFDCFLARFFMELTSVFLIIADLGTIIYLWDLHSSFKNGRLLRRSIPFAQRYKCSLLFILLLACSIGVIDLVVVNLAITGHIGANTTSWPMFYQGIINSVCNLFLIRVQYKLEVEVKRYRPSNESPKKVDTSLKARQPVASVITLEKETFVPRAGTAELDPHEGHRMSPEDEKREDSFAPTKHATSIRGAKVIPQVRHSSGLATSSFHHLQRLVSISIASRFVAIPMFGLIGLQKLYRGPVTYTLIMLSLATSIVICLTTQIFMARIQISNELLRRKR